MIKHIVCFKLKDQAEGASKTENARKIKRDVEALAKVVPGVLKLEVGINFVDDPMAFDIALYSEFESREALVGYGKHPEHVKVAQFIGKTREQRVVVDYEA